MFKFFKKKLTTFEKTVAKMDKLVGNRFYVMYYEYQKNLTNSKLSQNCRIYVYSNISTQPYDTWDEAYDELCKLLDTEKIKDKESVFTPPEDMIV